MYSNNTEMIFIHATCNKCDQWSLKEDVGIAKTTHTDDNTDPITSQYEQTINEHLRSIHHKIFFKDL